MPSKPKRRSLSLSAPRRPRFTKFDRARGEAERRASHPRPAQGNTGVHHRLAPYAGPKTFEVFNPGALAAYRGVGARPVGFVVTYDAQLHRPYGAFRVRWRDIEVGRSLSWPDYGTCARLRAWARAVQQRLGSREVAFGPSSGRAGPRAVSEPRLYAEGYGG